MAWDDWSAGAIQIPKQALPQQGCNFDEALQIQQNMIQPGNTAGTVAVLSAGIADADVAEECRCTADLMGCYAFRLSDVSVDGLHRMLHNLSGILPLL